MEFHEKLQQLRKDRDLTQEELAADLYVSRTAISKWESGRGCPSIDSLRDISRYFSITIDELLSGDALLFIAEKDSKTKERKLYDFLMGMIDVCSFMFIILPLYPKVIDGYIYSVNLISYAETTSHNILVYWIMFSVLSLLGAAKLVMIKYMPEINTKIVSDISVALNVLTAMLLIISRQTYASVLMVVILVIKMILLLKKA